MKTRTNRGISPHCLKWFCAITFICCFLLNAAAPHPPDQSPQETVGINWTTRESQSPHGRIAVQARDTAEEHLLSAPGLNDPSSTHSITASGRYIVVHRGERLLLIEGWHPGERPKGKQVYVGSSVYSISPNDAWIAWEREGRVYVRSLKGRTLYVLSKDSGAWLGPGWRSGFVWDSSGRQFAWAQNGAIIIGDVTTKTCHPLVRFRMQIESTLPSYLDIRQQPSLGVAQWLGGTDGQLLVVLFVARWFVVSIANDSASSLQTPKFMETVVALPGNQFFGYSRHGLLTWSHADGKPREQNWDWNFAGGRSAPDSVAPLANRAVIAGTLSPTPEEDQRAGHSAEYDYIGPLTWIIELFDLQEGTSRVLHRESYLYKGPNMDGEFGTAPGPSVALSPDGKYIAFFAPEGEVCIIPNRFDPQTEAVLSPVSKSGLRGPLRIIRCDPMPSVDPKKTHANPLTP